MARGFVHPELVVETGWLADHLDDTGVRVLDCSTHLPRLPDNSYYTVRPGRDEFLVEHIPGSAFVDGPRCRRYFGRVPLHAALRRPVANAMSALGISRDTLVVSYSAANHWWASRMRWMLRVFGHERAAVLNGGFQKWRKEGRPIEGGSARPCAKAHYEARAARREMVSKEDVLAAIGNADTCTINALRPEQHTGTGGVYYGRRGHIQGSVNLPAMGTVDENNV